MGSPDQQQPASSLVSGSESGGPTRRDEALKLILEEARKAAGENPERFDYLVGQVLQEGATASGPTEHEVRMDNWRVRTTIVMIAGLFAIVLFVVIVPGVPSATTQYVSLMSGLAGIALGWLFGSGASANLRRSGDAEAPSALRRRSQKKTG